MNKNRSLNYLLIMAAITVVFAVIYATVQQSYRAGANDPQIQMARDISNRLRHGKTTEGFFADTVDIAESLSPFVSIYDATKKPVRTSGYLDGKFPELPEGVFDFAKAHGENQVTWQPRSGVRMAMVVSCQNSSRTGFVAAGRSLREVEEREHNLIITAFLGWLICIGLVLIYAALQFYRTQKHRAI
jgi:sensor histidine kinase regulating citrate/malate metabolism